MARGKRAFRQSDVTAAVKAVRQAGEQVARVEVDPTGLVKVFTGSPEEDPDTGAANSDIVDGFRNARNALRSKKRRAPVEP